MICPECGEDNNVVICSRQKKTTHRRRRICVSCGYRFSTTEYYVPDRYCRKAKPRKIFRAISKGHWIRWTDDRNDYCTCSECGYGDEGEVKLGDETPYCPMCGAKMEKRSGE